MSQEETIGITLTGKYCPLCFSQFKQDAEKCPEDGTILRGANNDPLVGTTFAERYEIISLVGFGGMSIVYKARHKLMDRFVAIKMLHGYLSEDITTLARFKREAQAAASLSHPNIIAVHDFGISEDGKPFLVMDFLAGESLEATIKHAGKLPYEKALPIFKQIAEGLTAAHLKGLVHSDLKPANIILCKESGPAETAKILDFGLVNIKNIHIPNSGGIYGSPLYMSPEQCQGKEPDSRSDIYSFGCLMYETLGGEPPLKGANELETMNLHVGKKPQTLRSKLSDQKIPTEFFALVEACLEKKPEDRPQNSLEIVQLLTSLMVSPGSADHALVEQRKITGNYKKRQLSHSKSIITVLVVALIGSSVVWHWLFRSGTEVDRGTIAEKLILQFYLYKASDAIKSGDFKGAQKLLFQARDLASRLDDGTVRSEMVLKLFARLYSRWEGHSADLIEITRSIITIENQRLLKEFDHQLAALNNIANSKDSAVTIERARLRLEAQIPEITLLAPSLWARGFERQARQLLSTTISQGHRLLPADFEGVASLEALYALALELERDYGAAKPHYEQACEIYKKQSKGNPLAYAHALSQLGQFNVNTGNFSTAEKQLQEALGIARKETDLDLQVLTLRSLADLKRKTATEAEAMPFTVQAEKLNVEAQKLSLEAEKQRAARQRLNDND